MAYSRKELSYRRKSRKFWKKEMSEDVPWEMSDFMYQIMSKKLISMEKYYSKKENFVIIEESRLEMLREIKVATSILKDIENIEHNIDAEWEETFKETSVSKKRENIIKINRLEKEKRGKIVELFTYVSQKMFNWSD